MTTFPKGLTSFSIWASSAVVSMFPIHIVDFKLEEVEEEDLEDEDVVAMFICKKGSSQEVFKNFQKKSNQKRPKNQLTWKLLLLKLIFYKTSFL